MEGHIVEVQIKLYWFGLLSAGSRYDSQGFYVLRDTALLARLLLVAVVDVLGLHGCMEMYCINTFQFYTLREEKSKDKVRKGAYYFIPEAVS